MKHAFQNLIIFKNTKVYPVEHQWSPNWFIAFQASDFLPLSKPFFIHKINIKMHPSMEEGRSAQPGAGSSHHHQQPHHPMSKIMQSTSTISSFHLDPHYCVSFGGFLKIMQIVNNPKKITIWDSFWNKRMYLEMQLKIL